MAITYDRIISRHDRAYFAATPAKPAAGEKMHFVTRGVNLVLATVGFLVFRGVGITDGGYVTAACLANSAGEGSTAVALPPPLALAKAFFRSSCGRNFPLFSGVKWEGLSTSMDGDASENALSGVAFSKADDCADLVFRFKWLFWNGYFASGEARVCVSVW